MEDRTEKKIEPEAIKAEFMGIWYGLLGSRPGIKRMLEYLEENGFFEAPASVKYHGNYPGGLAEHSLNVYKRLHKMNVEEAKSKPERGIYSQPTIAIVALLHDVCKMDAYKVKKIEGEKTQYEYTNAFPVGHGEKSVIKILRIMPLSDEEIIAIRWHMGAFDHSTKGGSYDMNYAFRESKLAAMLHIADMMATHLDER